MSESYLGEVKVISWTFAPKGWAFCNGQLLPIAQNQALFSILGTTYGGDGRVTFARPDLRGRYAIHAANASPGERYGEPSHTLTIQEMPAHNHTPVGNTDTASSPSLAGNLWAPNNAKPFSAAPNTSMNPGGLLNTG